MSLSKCFKKINAGLLKIPSVIVGRCKKDVTRLINLEYICPVD
jgi:hypothetical protein